MPPTAPSKSFQNALKDARDTYTLANKQLPAILKADAKKKRKPVTRASLDAYKKLIDSVAKSGGAVQAGKSGVASATSAEKKARAPLYAALVDIRDDVAQSFAEPEHVALRRAFLEGTTLDINSTPRLLAAASAVLEAYGDGQESEHAAQAKQAGVDKASIKKLSSLHDTLAAADTTQGERIGARIGASSTKKSGLAQMTKQTTLIKAVLVRVMKRTPAARAAVRSKAPRHKVKKRAPKTPKS